MKNATKLHCAAAADVDTRERLDWRPDAIGPFVETLDKADTLIGHNIQRHDIPLITRLTGWKPRPTVIIRDTMICARTIYPNVKDTDKRLVQSGKMPPGKRYQGRHNIGAWGYRLGNPKGDYADIMGAKAREAGLIDPDEILQFVWGEWSEFMHEYMLQDVDSNLSLWDHLKVDLYSRDAIELEHRIAYICELMEQCGVPFNSQAAQALHVELVDKKDKIERRLIEHFGSWLAPVSPTKHEQFPQQKPNKNQSYFWWEPDEKFTYVDPATGKKVVEKKWTDTVVGDDGKAYPMRPCYSKLKRVEFNPGSRDHIAKVLMAKGWKSEKFTPGGKPQIDEETVAGIIARYPEFDGLGELLMVEKRLSQLVEGKQAWLKVVQDDGRIHGVINPMGTGTSRAAHMYPNLGQVPAVKNPYGAECRSLFYAPKGWKIVGADQQGLELRGLAHYLHPLDGGKYAEVVLDGDPHWLHAVVMGLAEGDRDKHSQLHTIIREDGSKRYIYAYIYGCWYLMAGEIIFACVNKARLQCGTAGAAVYERFFGKAYDPSERALKKVGERVNEGFAKRITGFKALKENLAKQVAKFGWVPGLDGRRIPIRSEHSSLNYMIQSCGAIICKRWVCDAFDAILARGYKHGWDGDFVFGLWVHDEIQVWVRDGLEEEVKAILKECAAKAGEPYGFRVRLDGDAKVGSTWCETH